MEPTSNNRKLTTKEMGRLSEEQYLQIPKLPLRVVCDNIRSAQNVGSIFRTSDAFLVERIDLCGISARPPHREIQRTALGATRTVPWKGFDSVADALQECLSEGYRIILLEQTTGSMPLQELNPEPGVPLAVVLGNEVSGVSPECMDIPHTAVEIPQYGTKHSLNVSVCAGIALNHLCHILMDPEGH